MGAWTSTFMIGISNRLYLPFLQLKDTSQSTYEESEGFEPPPYISLDFSTGEEDWSDLYDPNNFPKTRAVKPISR